MYTTCKFPVETIIFNILNFKFLIQNHLKLPWPKLYKKLDYLIIVMGCEKTTPL